MRIDSSGRLLVGVSTARSNVNSTTPNLQIETATTVATAAASLSVINNQGAGGSTAALNLGLTRGTSLGGTTKVEGTDDLGYINFLGSDGTNFIPGARIFCTVDGTTGTNDMPGRLAFSTTADGSSSPTERVRITSAGFFKARGNSTYGSTSSSRHEFVTAIDDEYILLLQSNATNGQQYGIAVVTSNDQNDSTRSFIKCEGAATERFTARSNGGLANYSANNVNLASDERLKKDISPLETSWDKVKQIEVVNFRYKDCNQGDPLLYGVIAQQVQPIVPELVVVTQEAKEATEDKEATPEYFGIREQPMYWLAIKALQEAMDRIETLEAQNAAFETRLAALEAK
jgi:hypothetical protein